MGPRLLCAIVLVVAAAACTGQERRETVADAAFDAAGASLSSRVERRGLISSVDVQRSPHSTISAVVEAETAEDASVLVSLTSDDVAPPGPPRTELGTRHHIPVVGMRAETAYDLEITAETADGAEESVTIHWATGALPDDLPQLTLTTAEPEAMAGGFTIFNAMSYDDLAGAASESTGGNETPHGFVVAVDDAGEVVWYYRTGPAVQDVSLRAGGTFLLSVNDTVIREIDLLGNTVRELATGRATELQTDFLGASLISEDSEPIAVESAHHELAELDNGNLLTLSTELLRLDPDQAAALCPDHPETDVISDVVVELTPEGEVVQEWRLADVLDPLRRPGTEMCVPQPAVAPPTWFYADAEGTSDWTHANAVTLDRDHNQLLVSLRHLNEVIAIRYHDDREGPAGELLWSLGAEGTLEMQGAGAWMYHQHAVKRYPDGTILLYDNGNGRPGSAMPGSGRPGAPPQSRAVLYEVDETAGTVTQVWEHGDRTLDGRPLFTPFLGDADLLDNGDVLITYGAASLPDGTLHGRLVEVVRGEAPDGSQDRVVFDLTVGGQDKGWTVYRSERLTSLYGEPWSS